MITASAPGKLVLMGEYAVVYGHAALVAAVDVRAVCVRAAGALAIDKDAGGLVDACLAAARAAYAGADNAVDGIVTLDTSSFADRNAKYGLGSSAAACVALLRALLPRQSKDELHVVAQKAHRDFQRGRGSGVDVCASVYGGLQRYVRDGDQFDVQPMGALPAGLSILPVWTGVSADTRAFLREVERLPDVDVRMDELSVSVDVFARATSIGQALQAVEDACLLLGELGEAAGVDIVSDEIQQIVEVAADFDGAAKPSGAGGGDVALVFVKDDAAVACAGALVARGFRVLPFALGVDGVTVVGDGA